VAREPRLAANYRHQVPRFVKRPKPHTHDSIRHVLKILSSRIECFLEEIVKKNTTLASVLDCELSEAIYFSIPEPLFHGST
jgi:predicted HTH transcriptional regulator